MSYLNIRIHLSPDGRRKPNYEVVVGVGEANSSNTSSVKTSSVIYNVVPSVAIIDPVRKGPKPIRDMGLMGLLSLDHNIGPGCPVSCSARSRNGEQQRQHSQKLKQPLPPSTLFRYPLALPWQNLQRSFSHDPKTGILLFPLP